MSRYYNNDPFWMRAKFNSVCSCGARIVKGSRIFYYPLHHEAVCEKCGEKGARDLAAEKSMDATGTDCAYDQ